ncbi:hypothetical protein R1flu_010205 [Riccia fluitans]|uniref:Uncharacterized protein n=1 Tax=Riccia fluitans TaxID=41844 RepID=A0ABD1Z580_9MARC
MQSHYARTSHTASLESQTDRLFSSDHTVPQLACKESESSAAVVGAVNSLIPSNRAKHPDGVPSETQSKQPEGLRTLCRHLPENQAAVPDVKRSKLFFLRDSGPCRGSPCTDR